MDLPYIYLPNGQVKVQNKAKGLAGAGKELYTGYKQFKKGKLGGAFSALTTGAAMLQHSVGDKAQQVVVKNTSEAEVVMFSGCKDKQYSADTRIAGRATGAMSHALVEVLRQNPHPSLQDLLAGCRNILKGKYQQTPQLSAGHKMDMTQPFTL